MTADERRQQLTDFLARRGFADLSVLVSELGVSESTVRRDLSQLEEDGIARRTHGGAVYVSDRHNALSYSARETRDAAEKEAIGKAAAELIADGETILLDGGTTTFQVAQNLMNRSLQVVTNSLPIATLLNVAPNIELTLIGGYIYPRTGVALGPMAQGMLESLSVSKAIFSVAGFTEEALYNMNVLMVDFQQQMMCCAGEVIVVTDSSKFGKRGLAKVDTWENIDYLVTDDRLSDEWRNLFDRIGTKLIMVENSGHPGPGLNGSKMA